MDVAAKAPSGDHSPFFMRYGLPNTPAAVAAAPAPVQPPQTAGANPRYVKFIFLAGRRQELQPYRASLDPYGESGGEWRPWLPDPRDEVDLLVQEVIQRERLISDGAIPLDNELDKRLKEAENGNKIVVIVVDLWTLRLEDYRKHMRDVVDPKQFVNCVIVVPWNPQDSEAVNQRQTLEMLLQATFVNRTANDSPGNSSETGAPSGSAVIRTKVASAPQLRITGLA